MTFDEWFQTYPLPAEIDGMDETDRQQWTWALRSAYKTGAQRQWQGLTDEEIFETHKQVDSMQYLTFGKAIEAKLKEKNT